MSTQTFVSPAGVLRGGRILLVEPDSSLALAIGTTLTKIGAAVIVARTLDATWRELEQVESFDAAVVDLELPGGRAGEIPERLRKTPHPCFSVMLANERAPETVKMLLDSGAIDFLFKPFPSDVLLYALCRAAEATFTMRSRLRSSTGWGAAERSSSPEEGLVREPAHQPAMVRPASALPELVIDGAVCKLAETTGLSSKEVAVLRYIALGYRYRDIAGKLDISPRTVKMHAAAVRRKAGVNSKHELLRKMFGGMPPLELA